MRARRTDTGVVQYVAQHPLYNSLLSVKSIVPDCRARHLGCLTKSWGTNRHERPRSCDVRLGSFHEVSAFEADSARTRARRRGVAVPARRAGRLRSHDHSPSQSEMMSATVQGTDVVPSLSSPYAGKS